MQGEQFRLPLLRVLVYDAMLRVLGCRAEPGVPQRAHPLVSEALVAPFISPCPRCHDLRRPQEGSSVARGKGMALGRTAAAFMLVYGCKKNGLYTVGDGDSIPLLEKVPTHCFP